MKPCCVVRYSVKRMTRRSFHWPFGFEVGFDPIDDRARFGVDLVAGALAPNRAFGRACAALLRSAARCASGFFDGLGLRGFDLPIVRIILFGFQDRLAQNAVGHGVGLLVALCRS